MTKRMILPAVLLMLSASVATADDDDRDSWGHHYWHRSVQAPELDPGQALSALLLISGSVAIVRGRRRKK